MNLGWEYALAWPVATLLLLGGYLLLVRAIRRDDARRRAAAAKWHSYPVSNVVLSITGTVTDADVDRIRRAITEQLVQVVHRRPG